MSASNCTTCTTPEIANPCCGQTTPTTPTVPSVPGTPPAQWNPWPSVPAFGRCDGPTHFWPSNCGQTLQGPPPSNVCTSWGPCAGPCCVPVIKSPRDVVPPTPPTPPASNWKPGPDMKPPFMRLTELPCKCGRRAYNLPEVPCDCCS